MKVKEFVCVLREYARVIDAHGGNDLAAVMDQLIEAWSPAMTWSMKNLLGRSGPRAPLPEAEGVSVRDFREALVRLQHVVGSIAKKGFNDDLAALINSLEPHDKKDLAAFVVACQQALERVNASKTKADKSSNTSIDEALIRQYVERLQATHKDSAQFVPVYEELQANKRIKQAELAKIASLVAYETAAGTSRKEALRRIWLIHDNYATAAAKSKFSSGKSAA
jgi:hypothetical protein